MTDVIHNSGGVVEWWHMYIHFTNGVVFDFELRGVVSSYFSATDYFTD